MSHGLTDSAQFIAADLPAAVADAEAKSLMETLFGGRYHQCFAAHTAIRDALTSADGFIPFAGTVHSYNPTSGSCGGVSVIWFPTEEDSSIPVLVVGTAGSLYDEGLLARDRHRRCVRALRRYLSSHGIQAWAKSTPIALTHVLATNAHDCCAIDLPVRLIRVVFSNVFGAVNSCCYAQIMLLARRRVILACW